MTDTEPVDSESTADAPGARMILEPDSIHETEDGDALDCPECGTTVTIMHLLETGHCPNYLDEDDADVGDDAERVEGPDCTADLSLELVWED